jgi:hypothetical protein
MDQRDIFRQQTLRSFGAAGTELAELLAYNQSAFVPADWPDIHCPLPDEPFVEIWRSYAAECQAAGNILPLRKYLVQLNYPIAENISQRPEYLAAVRAGVEPDDDIPGLVLTAPHRCRIIIHATAAGAIPLLIAGEREDFVSLLRALSLKNEPVPVPVSMGGCIISGYNNWRRIRMAECQFAALFPDAPSGLSARDRLKWIIPRRELYQDRFILLSDGYYSGVLPAQVGLSAKAWREYSLIIRREHECTHYFTRRFLRTMRNNLFDELIADYAGIVSAIGHYRADWALLFLGLEDATGCRPGGRFNNYLGNPPLSRAAVTVLERLVRRSTSSLEYIDRTHSKARNWPDVHPGGLVALSSLTLEELASERAEALFLAALGEFVIRNGQPAEVI